jgi:dTDP-4-dehydrorhamnose 3,5-epimerase-like enzyme
MSILGLEWTDSWRVENGLDSYVVPFARLRPAQVVFHGEDEFSYRQFGVHLGQDDVLTFLGPSQKTILGHFIDCRKGSPTHGERQTLRFTPSSSRSLRIPRGVGHDFEGLETIYTLNTYDLYLPSPTEWLSSDWDPRGDVINVPSDVLPDAVPELVPNGHRAGGKWYSMVALQQKVMIPLLSHEYPVTRDVEFDSGESHRIALLKRARRDTRPEWEPIDEIDGLGWVALPYVPSGPDSGFVPLVEPYPLYFIDHGEESYSHDAYGIHLGQEDHLLFLGPLSQDVTIEFLDTREESATWGRRTTVIFQPSPTRYLKIPAGVGHALEHLENVFTVNRAAVFLPSTDESAYRPGNDVIDWPRSRDRVPRLAPNTRPAPARFYEEQIQNQRALRSQPAQHATPAVMLVDGANGRSVRVALRKRLRPAETAD